MNTTQPVRGHGEIRDRLLKDRSPCCLTVPVLHLAERPSASLCPFHDDQESSCRAALSDFPVNSVRRLRYCHSEDHDDCPIFLGKILRNRR